MIFLQKYTAALLLGFSSGCVLASLPLGVLSLFLLPVALAFAFVAFGFLCAASLFKPSFLPGAALGNYPIGMGVVCVVISFGVGVSLASAPLGVFNFYLIPISLGLWLGAFMAVLLCMGRRLSQRHLCPIKTRYVTAMSFAAVIPMTLLLSTQTPLFMAACITSAWTVLGSRVLDKGTGVS